LVEDILLVSCLPENCHCPAHSFPFASPCWLVAQLITAYLRLLGLVNL
jgi:hypothetical protein